MKRNIIICEYISTGINFVDDVRARGYEPVLLEGHYAKIGQEAEPFLEARNAINKRLGGSVKIIPENPNYEEILEQVRALDPIAVVAGSEFGVPLAVRLAEDLGLVGNPTSALPSMTQKDAMQEALKKHGLRYIRGKVVTSEEEALAYYKELGTEDVVVKRVRGAGSQGVYLCHGYEEMKRAVKNSFSVAENCNEEQIAILMQERIIGTEYIVNTVSCRGRHRVVSVWKYNKIKMANGASAYDNAMTVTRLEVGHSSLIRYACRVAEAVGVQNGPIHGEYMVDEKGPVLIEVNCRPMGGGLRRKYIEQIFGHHETDVALDSILNPDKFAQEFYKPYRLKKFGALKTIILSSDTKVESSPIIQIAKHLKSYYSSVFERIGRTDVLSETIDLETSGGMIFLLHEDERLVRDECELLHLLESKYPRILFQSSSEEELTDCPKPDPGAVMKAGNCHGATLVFSDTATSIEGATVVSANNLLNAYDSYEQGILDLSEPQTFADSESLFEQIFMFIGKIRQGGRVLVPESTYCHLPYGMEGMEILFKVAGLRIELPLGDMTSLLVASVE